MKRRIMLTGGGTGGSVTPLLAIAEYLRRDSPDIEMRFLGSASGPEASLCAAANIPFQAIPSGKFRRYWSWSNWTDGLQLWQAWRVVRRLLKTWPPDVVVSAGSFVAVPVVWAAHRTGSRILIHQQDVRPGLANRLMAPAADVITVTFEKSVRDFPAKKVMITGNPVRPEILLGSRREGQRLFHLTSGVPTLLVVGGGTGSQALNELLGGLAPRLMNDWQIIHVIGQRAGGSMLSTPRYQRYPLLTSEYPHALAAADLIISRAGLGAITELANLGKPAIFLPLPRSHQEENARVISDLNAGQVVPQDEFAHARVMNIIEDFRRDAHLGDVWAKNIRRLAHPEATEKISRRILELANA